MKHLLGFIASLLVTSSLLSAAQDQNNTITLTTLKGKTIHITGTDKGFTIPEYKGQIMFVEFWGTHCPPCLMSIPHYIELTKKYKGKMSILAVEVQATPKEQLKSFIQTKGINYDIVDYKTGYRFVEYITQRAGWKGSIPLLLILDKEGSVQIVQPGLIPQEQLEKVIEEMLNKDKKPASTQAVTKNNTKTTQENNTSKMP